MSELSNEPTNTTVPNIQGIVTAEQRSILQNAEDHEDERAAEILHDLGVGALMGASEGGVAVYLDKDDKGNDTYGYISLALAPTLGDHLNDETRKSKGLPPAEDVYKSFFKAQTTTETTEGGEEDASVEAVPALEVTYSDMNHTNQVHSSIDDARRRGSVNEYVMSSSALSHLATLRQRGEITDAGLMATTGQILSAVEPNMGIEKAALKVIESSGALSESQLGVVKKLSDTLESWKQAGVSIRDFVPRLSDSISALIDEAQSKPEASEVYIMTLQALSAGVNTAGADELMSYMNRFRKV